MAAKPHPKRLILNLLAAAAGKPLSSRQAVQACALFGVSENSVRVTLARLSSEGLLASPSRGQYQLTSRASTLADDVGRWRDALSRLQPWSGDWLAVHCAGLGRSDRSALRQRERALELNGFAELEKGLFLRPDNLRGGVAAVRERLYALGLESDAVVFHLAGLDPQRQDRAMTLWPLAELDRQYRRTADKLAQWLARADQLDPKDAARESFVLGEQAIRQMVFDPLLPEDMVDAGARQAFFEVLLRYDQVGHEIWARLYRAAARDASLS